MNISSMSGATHLICGAYFPLQRTLPSIFLKFSVEHRCHANSKSPWVISLSVCYVFITVTKPHSTALQQFQLKTQLPSNYNCSTFNNSNILSFEKNEKQHHILP